MSKSSSALQTFTSSPLRRVTGDLSVIQRNFSSTKMLTLVIQYISASETDIYEGLQRQESLQALILFWGFIRTFPWDKELC